MAGDWIKMRGGLLSNPKVIRMSRFLSQNEHFREWFSRGTRISCKESVYELCDVTVVTRVTVGTLLSVWSAANEVANEDGFIANISLFEVDEMAGVPGFGDAMELVGWCKETNEGVTFPNFAEHNIVGKSRLNGAKTGAQRTKEWRDRNKPSQNVTRDSHRDVTVTRHGDDREEKRREEKIVNTETPLPPKGGTDDGDNAKPAKRTRKPRQAVVYSEDFLKFWAHYPKQQGKAAAADVFESLKPSPELLIEMIDTVERFKVTADWNRDGGQYIPHASTWLNQRRWEDKPTEAPNPHLAKTDKPKLSFKDQQAASALQFINSMTGNGNNGTQSLTGGHLDAIS